MSFFDWFGEDTLFVLDEPARIAEACEAVTAEFTMGMSGRLEKGYILPKQAELIIPAEKVAPTQFAAPEDAK